MQHMEWLQTCQDDDTSVPWEEDGEEGHKDPKNHSLRIAEIGCFLGFPHLNKNHKMAYRLFGREQQLLLSTINKTKHLELARHH